MTSLPPPLPFNSLCLPPPSTPSFFLLLPPSSPQICNHTNCMFELISVDPVMRAIHPSHQRSSSGMEYSAPPPQLRLKGQMMVLSNLSSIAFLGSPA